VLCVSPRFAPVNAADSHRLRLLIPHLEALGCAVEVLTVDADTLPGPHDPWLTQGLPAALAVHRVRAWPVLGWGFGGLAQRSFFALHRKGNDLLASGRFDLVFFSTTEFLVHGLGPLWQRRWGIPFCMDFQDPWVNDYYRHHPGVVPPGGRLKFGISDGLHRIVERAVVPRCSGFLSVSPAYLPMLQERYGNAVAHQPRLVAGFPGEPAEASSISASLPAGGRPADAPKVWRYVGRGGDDMAFAVAAFFQAWKKATEQGLVAVDAVRFEALGTSYAPAEQAVPTLEPVARQVGLTASVSEATARLGYRDMLTALATSDALIVFGSDDSAYTASKIYPYLLAGRPLLAIYHRQSSVVALMEKVGGGTCVTFDSGTSSEELADKLVNAWFTQGCVPVKRPLDTQAFEPFTAAYQAGQVVRWWNEIARHRVIVATGVQ
jgi:hypothetical protein